MILWCRHQKTTVREEGNHTEGGECGAGPIIKLRRINDGT